MTEYRRLYRIRGRQEVDPGLSRAINGHFDQKLESILGGFSAPRQLSSIFNSCCQLAIRANFVDGLRLLIKTGKQLGLDMQSQLDLVNDARETLVMIASLYSLKCLSVLLEEGASPDATSEETPMPITHTCWSIQASKMLIAAGASVLPEERTTRSMGDPIYAAFLADDPELLECLFHRGAYLPKPLNSHFAHNTCRGIIRAAPWKRRLEMALVFVDVPAYVLLEICKRSPAMQLPEKHDKRTVAMFQSAKQRLCKQQNKTPKT